MQVILMEKVVNLGSLGDVVKVKDGYARNFLIPQGKAKRATQANLRSSRFAEPTWRRKRRSCSRQRRREPPSSRG